MRPQNIMRERRARRVAAMGVVALALVASACSGSPSSSSTTTGNTSLVALATPSTPVQGCTYTVGGQVQPYLPTGKNPHFASFSPDPSANAALNSIKTKGGTGAVSSFELPSGTMLRSGPSSSAPVVGTVPSSDQLQVYDPIVWTDATGQYWLAAFLACGGSHLYWVGLDDLQRTNSASAKMVGTELAQLRAAPSYVKTARGSFLPILIDPTGHVVWKDRAIPFDVGRSELTSVLL
jgi:hypothetical protein